MIYACAAFRSKGKTALVAFDTDYSVYGPYAIEQWSGEPFDDLSHDEMLFGFCSFKNGVISLSAEDHQFEMRNHEDGQVPECIGYIFSKTKVESNVDSSSVDVMLRSLAGKAMVREYVRDNFMSAWGEAQSTGIHDMRRISEALDVSFNQVESLLVG